MKPWHKVLREVSVLCVLRASVQTRLLFWRTLNIQDLPFCRAKPFLKVRNGSQQADGSSWMRTALENCLLTWMFQGSRDSSSERYFITTFGLLERLRTCQPRPSSEVMQLTLTEHRSSPMPLISHFPSLLQFRPSPGTGRCCCQGSQRLREAPALSPSNV